LLDIFLQDPSLKIIHLKRRNHLRTLVSLRIAEKNKLWSKSVYEAGESTTSKAIRLNPEECLLHFRTMAEEECWFDNFFQRKPKMELFYEDLVHHTTAELRRVQLFLGVREQKLETLLARQNPEPLPALLLNFRELEIRFRNTEWHSYFTDGE